MIKHIIQTERLGLRKWIDADFIPFTEMNKDSQVMEYFPKILTDVETNELIKKINKHFDKYGFGLFAVEKLATKEFVGFTGFMIPTFESFFTPCIEIGWRITKQDWGKTSALRNICSQQQNINSVFDHKRNKIIHNSKASSHFSKIFSTPKGVYEKYTKWCIVPGCYVFNLCIENFLKYCVCTK